MNGAVRVLCAAVVVLSCAASLYASQGLLLYAPFDGDCVPKVAQGQKGVQVAPSARFVSGKAGQAVVADAKLRLSYPSTGNLDKRRGTVCMWVRPEWSGGDGKNHGLFADDIDFNNIEANNIYFWKWSVGTLRFDQRKNNSTYLTAGVQGWKAGEWRHIAATWDIEEGARLFIDAVQVAQRDFKWVVKPGRRLLIGSDWRGGAPADCAVDELRIYDRALTAGQLQIVMAGRELTPITYHAVRAPDTVAEGEPFPVAVEASADPGVERKWAVKVMVDGVGLGDFGMDRPLRLAPQAPASLGPFQVVIPRHFYLVPGDHSIQVEIVGTIGEAQAKRVKTVRLTASRPAPSPKFTVANGVVLRNGKRFLHSGVGMWYGRELYTADEVGQSKAAELARSGRLIDAVRCRMTDEVDCTQTDHGFEDFGTSSIAELAPGKRFRITGPKDSVKQTRKRRNREFKVLPAFSYRLKVSPRPTPHLLVVESINDAERYLEVTVDVAPGSRVGQHLSASGMGNRCLIQLGVAYTGREQGVDGQVFREYFLFFPKSDEVLVTVCHSGREREAAKHPGTPVSHMWAYEFVDPLGELGNPVRAPKAGPRRHVSLFYPQCPIMYDEYGFCPATETTRRASIRVLMEYLRFMGFDRLEFHPYAFSTSAYFKSALFGQSGKADVFDDVLPIAQRAGIEVLPRIDSLVFFDKLWEDDPENYQHGKDGEIRKYFGKVPDPLRPQVQKVHLDVLREMLERTKGYGNVPGVGFRANAKFGSLYVGSSASAPPQDTGYTQWDVTEFEKDTGQRLPVDKADARACYEWIKANCWKRWIDWRCRRIHAWWCSARDLVQSYGADKKLFVMTVIPYDHHFPTKETQWWGKGVAPLDQHRYHGLDPALYANEKGMVISRYINLDADRYNSGCTHNFPYWHDPRVPGLYRTAEGAGVELYYIYWELSTHPRGFRVGPEWPVGRGWMEPMTHALRTMNVSRVVFYNWQRSTMGREIGLREFCRAFRALPAVEPKGFEGQVQPAPDERLWIRWFGDRLAIVNDSREPRTVEVRMPARWAGKELAELATHTRVAADREGRLEIDLRAFDLRVLAAE